MSASAWGIRRQRPQEGKSLKSKTDAKTRRPAADSLMDDMDPALLQFIKTRVTSFMRWELLRFLHENPGTADSAENIAQYTGRSVETVRPELDRLVQAGVLSKRTLGHKVSAEDRTSTKQAATEPADQASTTIYSFSADPETRRLIDNFVTACQDRHFRIKAVYHIIKNAS
jgi:hypothetical protein